MTDTAFDDRDEVEIKLAKPFTFDGERVTSLTMRRPKLRDKLKAKKVKGDEEDRALSMFADLVERPMECLGELDEVDVDKLGEQYLAFTGRTAATDAS